MCSPRGAYLCHCQYVQAGSEGQLCACVSINQSIFYFMSVHIEVILDKKKKHNKKQHIITIYTNFPTGL